MARVLAALALVVVPALAADKDPWIRVTSTNFELFTTAGERAGRDLVKHFEQVHSFFVQRFGSGIDPTRKARIILFRSDKEYEPYRPNEFAAAFYHPGEYRDSIIMNNSVNDARSVAVHELTHLMVHQLGMDLPPWLNEGLAELYRNLEPRGSQVMVGRDIPSHMRSLATEKWIDLPVLLGVTHESPIYNEKSRAGIFYAESWKLVHMLHLHPEYKPHFRDLLLALPKGNVAAAFQKAYGKDLQAVQHDLRGYLSGGTISAFLFDIQLPKSVDAPEIETGASLPARLAIAEMLSNSRGRAEKARDEYAAIVHDYPGRWEVEEALGLFAWHQRKLDEAAGHFTKAEALGCKNGGMFLLWGRVLGYAGRTADAVTALAKASNLLQDSDEVKLEYGNALVRNGNWGTAVVTLRSVKKVAPNAAWRYYYNLAYALYKTGDTANAKALTAKAAQYAANSSESSAVLQLESALDRPARPVEQPKPAPLPAVEGTLENMECGKLARLHVRVDGAIKIFVIPDPRTVSITSGSGEPVDLQCGPQKKPAPLRIEYQAMPAASDVAGLVRTLEFK